MECRTIKVRSSALLEQTYVTRTCSKADTDVVSFCVEMHSHLVIGCAVCVIMIEVKHA